MDQVDQKPQLAELTQGWWVQQTKESDLSFAYWWLSLFNINNDKQLYDSYYLLLHHDTSSSTSLAWLAEYLIHDHFFFVTMILPDFPPKISSSRMSPTLHLITKILIHNLLKCNPRRKSDLFEDTEK
jgi:hypothetical protein